MVDLGRKWGRNASYYDCTTDSFIMTTPNSAIELLMVQSHEKRLNALLENYLIHHPDSPVQAAVQKAIASSNLTYKFQVLDVLLMYG